MFRIAHVSDLHVLSHTGAHWRAMLFNKRIIGYANLVLRRGRVHRCEYLLTVLEAASKSADHVVITGDITNLALESEYEEARSLLSQRSPNAASSRRRPTAQQPTFARTPATAPAATAGSTSWNFSWVRSSAAHVRNANSRAHPKSSCAAIAASSSGSR
jgi:3',5'-cyclic AMP phosphodiesterase CpdA